MPYILTLQEVNLVLEEAYVRGSLYKSPAMVFKSCETVIGVCEYAEILFKKRAQDDSTVRDLG